MTRILSLLPMLASLISAAEVTVNLAQPSWAFDPSSLPSRTHATLHSSGTPLRALLNRQNKFVFPSVSSGEYLLEVHCHDFGFEPLRVDVGSDGGLEYVKAWQTFRGNTWDNKGEKRGEGIADTERGNAKAEIEVNVLGKKEYFAERPGFSVMSLFANPMVLLGLFSLVLIVGMPYLLDNMDPETKAEFEEMQKKQGAVANPAAAMQNFDLAGWMAGSGSSSAQVSAPEKSDSPRPQKRKS